MVTDRTCPKSQPNKFNTSSSVVPTYADRSPAAGRLPQSTRGRLMAQMSRWSDLPADLLHVIYAKVSGLLHRVRFAAVCTSWRVAGTRPRYAAPPALPWHISSFGGTRDTTKRLYRPEDGEVQSIRIPANVGVVRRFVGAHDGGWVAAITFKHLRLVLFNFFSGAEVPLSVKQRKFGPYTIGPCGIRKIVFSHAPTSSDCALAALTCNAYVGLCRVGSCLEDDDDRWIMTQGQSAFAALSKKISAFADIAFCKGKLYGLTTHEELCWFDITNKHGGATSVRWLSVQRPPLVCNAYPFKLVGYGNHLFDLDGKLAMVRTWWSGRHYTMPLFEVFELVYDRQGNTQKWEELTSLGEYALFLGEACSRAVRVPVGGRGQVERNCIYAAKHATRQKNETHGERIKVAHASHHGMWLIPPRV